MCFFAQSGFDENITCRAKAQIHNASTQTHSNANCIHAIRLNKVFFHSTAVFSRLGTIINWHFDRAMTQNNFKNAILNFNTKGLCCIPVWTLYSKVPLGPLKRKKKLYQSQYTLVRCGNYTWHKKIKQKNNTTFGRNGLVCYWNNLFI